MWEKYISGWLELTGNSPTRILDSKNIKLDSPSSFLSSLTGVLGNPAFLHSYYTFIIECDITTKEILEISFFIKLSLFENIFVASGSLQNWIDLSVHLCKEENDFKMRYFGDCIVLSFEKLGLRPYWDKWQRKQLTDKSFILKEKRK